MIIEEQKEDSKGSEMSKAGLSEVKLFDSLVQVASFTTKSSQATVFFCNEKNLGIPVVLKQYASREKKRATLIEIKILSLLENIRA